MGPENERGPGNELGARRAEQFPQRGNYTLTPDHHRHHHGRLLV